MQLQTVFQKNLNALKDNNLKTILTEHVLQNDIKVINTNGYNLAYNGTPLHNTVSPLGEAKKIFDQTDNSISAITIVYGIGLGYLFQYTAQNSKGRVILYEPNLDILKMAFTLVDFSNEIKSNRIYVTTNFEDLNETLRNCYNEIKYPDIIYLPSYGEIFTEQMKADAESLKILVGGVATDYSYTKNRFYTIALKILKNIPYLVKETPLCNITNVFNGKTAIICSAGPTLSENLETLKKYQNNVVIFAVGPACKALINAGINPDFICVIEDRNCSSQLRGLDLSKSNLILEPFTNIAFHKKENEVKHIFSHTSNNLPPNILWKNLAGIDISEYYSRGTVSYCALNCARILGCNRLVLVGQDLAFLDGQIYSKDSVYKDLKLRFNEETKKFEVYVEDFQKFADAISVSEKNEIKEHAAQKRLEGYKNRITTIKGIQGNFLPTEAVYSLFASNISRYTMQFPDFEYINTSLRGAQLDGYKNMPLEDALKDTQPIDKENFTYTNSVDITNIISGLEKFLNNFTECENKIANARRLLVRFNTEYIRNRSLTKEMLVTLKKIITNYTELSINLASQNPLFDFITKKEQIEFENCLQTSEVFDLETTLNIAKLQTEYLDKTSENIVKAKETILSVIETLKGE